MVVATVVLRKPHRAAAKDGPATVVSTEGAGAVATVMASAFRAPERACARTRMVRSGLVGGAGPHRISRSG